MPQWRLDGGIYFVTWRLNDRQDRLSPEERSLVADAIKRYQGIRYQLSIFVVMDDHVHVLLQTLPSQDLSPTLQLWKGGTSHGINALRKTGGVRWQKDSRTELMRNAAAIQSRREYIYDNPRRRWGIEPHTYEWLESFE